MEVALVSAATGALKPVLAKLGALLGDKYKRLKGVHKDIKPLTHELAAMDAFLMKMSEEEDPDVQDKVWMNDEDCIDDFMLSVDDKDTKPDGFMEKIKHSLGKMKARSRISNEIGDLKKQIIEVGERNASYKTRQALTNTKNLTVDPRALAIFVHVTELVGVDEPKAEIIKMLNQDDARASAQQNLKLVSIVGFGGMGKTTLANQVYQEIHGQFECHAFLSVSRNPNIMNILRTILSEVTRKDYATTEAGSIQQLISKISLYLANRSYFVVVDDIWEADTWDVIKHAFPMNSSSNIVITTTRSIDVARACCSSFSGHIYSIRPLNMVHSRQLFRRRLFNSNEDFPSHLEKVSDQILQKCGGLPLAIITLSGLLANRERTEDLWNQVKDSIGLALERDHGVKRMMKILSLSYFDLPPHLKSCLLYMSIFPEDSIIGRKGLIRRWVGEGFIHKDERYTVFHVGERCFNELLNRSLIHPCEKNKHGKVKSCRVHDTILDFIISKSIEENFVTLLGIHILTIGPQSKVVRRLSLQGIKQGKSTMLTDDLVLSHVRSLNVFEDSMEIPRLQEFSHLRVLHLQNCYQLEEHHLGNIVRLFQLRYLNLEYTSISELPEQIGRLWCLEILDLRHTHVQELPSSIVNLRKLTDLLVSHRVKFPDGIAKMQALEILKNVMVSKQPFDFLLGLGQLKNLRKLDINFEVDPDSKDTNVFRQERNKAIVSSMCKLGALNLRSLTVREGSSLLQEPLCLPTLEKFIALSSVVPHVPKWMSSLRNLHMLFLEVRGLKQNDVCILEALPTLLTLNLGNIKGSNERLRISGETGFRFLRSFTYDVNYGLLDLMFEPGSMPKLEKLKTISLLVVEADSLDFGIENLPCLITVKFSTWNDVDA
uniref:Uncharacterized protein n=1 Tax=Avena sativa TaxID=4498 RepID=A0ACD6ALS3_AVESA